MRFSQFAGSNQEIFLLGLDQPMAIAQQLGLPLTTVDDRLFLEKIVQETVAAYSQLSNGMLLSPELGYSAAVSSAPDKGLAFCLERTLAESDPLSIPVLQSNWNVEYVRNNSAAAKLLLYAQVEESELITKLELVNELFDSCRYEGIDFLLELRIIDGKRLSDEAFQEEQLRLVRLFKDQASALLLEYPRTALGCLSVTAQLQKPWLLIDSPGIEYAEEKEQLRTALTGGAAGFLVRQSLLPSFAKGAFDLEQYRAYLQKEGRDRMLELARICTEKS